MAQQWSDADEQKLQDVPKGSAKTGKEGDQPVRPRRQKTASSAADEKGPSDPSVCFLNKLLHEKEDIFKTLIGDIVNLPVGIDDAEKLRLTDDWLEAMEATMTNFLREVLRHYRDLIRLQKEGKASDAVPEEDAKIHLEQELKFLMARIEKALQGPRFVVSQKDVQELMQLDNLNDVLKKVNEHQLEATQKQAAAAPHSEGQSPVQHHELQPGEQICRSDSFSSTSEIQEVEADADTEVEIPDEVTDWATPAQEALATGRCSSQATEDHAARQMPHTTALLLRARSGWFVSSWRFLKKDEVKPTKNAAISFINSMDRHFANQET